MRRILILVSIAALAVLFVGPTLHAAGLASTPVHDVLIDMRDRDIAVLGTTDHVGVVDRQRGF